jgi:hypothetical protein
LVVMPFAYSDGNDGEGPPSLYFSCSYIIQLRIYLQFERRPGASLMLSGERCAAPAARARVSYRRSDSQSPSGRRSGHFPSAGLGSGYRTRRRTCASSRPTVAW